MSQSPESATSSLRARFLVIAPQGMGDALEATPIVRALRAANPRARVDVAVLRTGPRELFRALPAFVDEVIYLPYWERGGTAFALSVLAGRWGRRYDASFLAYPSADWRYHLLLEMFASHRRFAHRYDGRGEIRRPGTRLIPVRLAHNVERNRDLLRAAGVVPDDTDGYLVPEVWRSDDAPDGVALHVGSITQDGMAGKRWSVERFIALARRLVDDGERVGLIVGPDEREESRAVLDAVPEVLAFEGSLERVARYLSRQRLVIASDNGIGHLAAGLGTPTLTIFGPTPLEFAPFAKHAVALRPSDCPPCFDVRRPVVECKLNIDFACLKAVTVEMVHARARAMLDATTVRSSA